MAELDVVDVRFLDSRFFFFANFFCQVIYDFGTHHLFSIKTYHSSNWKPIAHKRLISKR